MNPTPEEEQTGSKNCSFFRVRKRPLGSQRNIRQRKRSSSEDEGKSSGDDDSDSSNQSDDEGNVVVKINRGIKRRGLDAGMNDKNRIRSDRVKKILSKKKEEDDSSSEDEEVDKSRVTVSYKGTGEEVQSGPADMGATATVEIDTDQSKDARAIEERARKTREETENPLDDKTYKGLNSYAKYIEKKDSAAGSAVKMSTGPQRAPANIRATVRWDYAPDICKDYKETGYCGFGDSCKFMHDRSDYKFGWQLEREMQDGTYGEDDDDDKKYEISSDEEDLPFRCFICKESFTNPVVTKCTHYFCEKCALDNYRESQRCFACGEQTNGVFNPAKNLITKLNKIKAEEEQNVKKGSDTDEEDSD